jgi:hypothetical protein
MLEKNFFTISGLMQLDDLLDITLRLGHSPQTYPQAARF